MTRDAPIRLRIPRQDLQDFEIFTPTPEGAGAWAAGLPATNARQVAQDLRAALAQINRVELAPEQRFGILEALRPVLLTAAASLARRFLKQPLVMAAESRQMADLTNALYTLAATGYTLTAIHAIQRRDSIRNVSPAQLACESIHRAIRFTGSRLLQTFQLYRPVELHGWLDLHQLYALAEAQQLARLKVEDRLSGDGSICAAYLQALMLGCCKPNQLRQTDLSAIYRGLQDWSTLLEVRPDKEGGSLFLVDLDSDQPPLYSSLYHEPPGPRTRYVDTSPLIDHLTGLAAASEQGVVFDKDNTVSHALLEHLISSLGKMSMRNFARKRSGKTIAVTIGLSACHFYLAGEQTFERLLHGDDHVELVNERLPDNPFLARQGKRDKWQEANPEEDFDQSTIRGRDYDMEHEVQLDERTRALLQEEDEGQPAAHMLYPIHEVSIFDASPGGYCLEWTSELPGNIRTGDLVCVREDAQARWALAVIRWMSQLEEHRTLVGLELISPDAKALGARMQQKRGEETEPMRVLLLPEIKLVGQPPTLVTPRAGFKERQKIILAAHGEEFYIQLLRQVAVTGSFVQFEFRYIKQLGDVLAEDKSRPKDSPFDSLWTNI
jgi:hypothetical protein